MKALKQNEVIKAQARALRCIGKGALLLKAAQKLVRKAGQKDPDGERALVLLQQAAQVLVGASGKDRRRP